jgi:MFS family permease
VNTHRALSYRQLLAAREVRALLLATCLSRLAGRMFVLAIVLFALALADSPVLAGGVSFAAVAPGLVISPVAGALIDRVGSTWAITVDMIASAVFVATLAAAAQLDVASTPVLVVVVSLYSLTSPLIAAGIRALLPRLVPVNALDRANALDTATHGVSDVTGPALAGLLVAVGDIRRCCIGIDAGRRRCGADPVRRCLTPVPSPGPRRCRDSAAGHRVQSPSAPGWLRVSAHGCRR